MGPSIVLWLTIRNRASGAAPSRLSIPRRISPANQMRNKETVPCRYLFPASTLNRTWIPPLIIEPQTGVYFSNASTSVSDGIAFRYCSAGASAHVCCVDRRGRQPRCGSLRLAPVAGWQGVQNLLLTRLHAIVRHSMHRTRRRPDVETTRAHVVEIGLQREAYKLRTLVSDTPARSSFSAASLMATVST